MSRSSRREARHAERRAHRRASPAPRSNLLRTRRARWRRAGRPRPRYRACRRSAPASARRSESSCGCPLLLAGPRRQAVCGVTMEGLEGIRVVELGHMVSAAHATKIMADLGADVVKVEEPTGDIARLRGPFLGGIADPEKSGLFLYLNTNKRGVTLDLTDLRERPQLERLAEWAEIIVHNYTRTEMAARGLDYERLRAINPRLVLCSITPFGLTGPHRDYRAEEITMAHGGGWAWVAPGASDR